MLKNRKSGVLEPFPVDLVGMTTESITNSSLVSLSVQCWPIWCLSDLLYVFLDSRGVSGLYSSFLGRAALVALKWCVSYSTLLLSPSSFRSITVGVSLPMMGGCGGKSVCVIIGVSVKSIPSGEVGPAGMMSLLKIEMASSSLSIEWFNFSSSITNCELLLIASFNSITDFRSISFVDAPGN